jgi:hypothetical protein
MTEPRAHDYEDGNTLAGPLGEILAVDITSALTTCSGCGRHDAVAGLHVYAAAPGLVARCPNCEDVVLRYVRTPTAAWLDLRGTVSLHVPIEA